MLTRSGNPDFTSGLDAGCWMLDIEYWMKKNKTASTAENPNVRREQQ